MVTIIDRNRFTDHYLVRKIRAILTSADDPVEAHYRVLNLIRDHCEQVTSISLLRFRGGAIETLATRGRTPLVPIERSDGRAAGGTRLRRGVVLVTDARTAREPWKPCHPNLRSELSVPLWRGRGIAGELHADSDFENAFADEDIRMFEAIAVELVKFWKTRSQETGDRRQERLIAPGGRTS